MPRKNKLSIAEKSVAQLLTKDMQWRRLILVKKLTAERLSRALTLRALTHDGSREAQRINAVSYSTSARAQGSYNLKYIDSMCATAGFDRATEMPNACWYMHVATTPGARPRPEQEAMINLIANDLTGSFKLKDSLRWLLKKQTINRQIANFVTMVAVVVTEIIVEGVNQASRLGPHRSHLGLAALSVGVGALFRGTGFFREIAFKRQNLSDTVDRAATPHICEVWIETASEAGYARPRMQVMNFQYASMLANSTERKDSGSEAAPSPYYANSDEFTPIATSLDQPNFDETIRLMINRFHDSSFMKINGCMIFDVQSERPELKGTSLRAMAFSSAY